MKLYIVAVKLDRGTSHPYQATFRSKGKAKEFVTNKFKTDTDEWDGDRLECYSRSDEDQGFWEGFVEIITVDTARLKY